MKTIINTTANAHLGFIEGYATRFGEYDLNRDRVLRGAFLKSLIPAKPGRVKMLYQHRVEKPIGRWVQIKEDSRGLFVRGEIFLNTDLGRNVWSLISGGALDGLSIGFRTKKARRSKKGRDLLELDLWEISIVTFPMAPGARISNWRAADGLSVSLMNKQMQAHSLVRNVVNLRQKLLP